MENHYAHLLSGFHMIGISYRTLSSAERGRYAVGPVQYENYLQNARRLKIPETFLVSTCNRTEIYSFGGNVEKSIQAFCEAIETDRTLLGQHILIKRGKEAIQHGFRVASGLESQILGDYEIVGQMKKAFRFSEEHGGVGLMLDRVFKHILQAARKVRATTEFSSGTVSVAHAAAKYIKNAFLPNDGPEKILMIGIGKIGRNTAMNIRDLFPSAELTLTNRTLEKAAVLANVLHAKCDSIDACLSQAHHFDCIITASGDTEPVLTLKHLDPAKKYVLVDLAIPNNVAFEVRKRDGVDYAHVDLISQVNDKTLEMRAAEIPKVENIIQDQFIELQDWLRHRKVAAMIKQMKTKLHGLESHFACEAIENQPEVIQKVINKMVTKLKTENSPKPGCNFLESYLEYLEKIETV